MIRPKSITMATLIVALAISACSRDETRSVTCHSHKVSDGERTECQ